MSLGKSSLEDLSNIASFKKPEGEAARLVEHASADESARVLFGFARFPVSRIGQNRDGVTLVQFADLRFTEPGGRGSFALDVPVPTER